MSSQTECACTDVLPSNPVMFCDTAVGRDTTGNFSLSFKGLAVRTDCNRFIAFQDRFEETEEEITDPHDANRKIRVKRWGRRLAGSTSLTDVTGLTLSGCDALIYRVPVTAKNIEPGDMVLISDCPFQVLYVTEKKGEILTGFNGSGEQITYLAPERLGDCARYIRIMSVLDVVSDKDHPLTEDEIILVAGLLCCQPGGRGAGMGGYALELMSSTIVQNVLPTTLKTTGAKLPLLLALQQSQCLESYILTKAFQGHRI